jgi:hypothetical protein
MIIPEGDAHMENYNVSLRYRMETEPDFFALIMDTQSKLRNGHYDEFIVNCAFLTYRNTIEPEDTWAFIVIHTGILSGEILTARINVGEEPLSDDDEEGNNAILSTIGSPIHAAFQPGRGGSASDDGWIKWKQPLDFQQNIFDKERNRSSGFRTKALSPGLAALEVGYIHGTNSLRHLIHDVLYARWPYGHDDIMIFAPTEEFRRKYNPYYRLLDNKVQQ